MVVLSLSLCLKHFKSPTTSTSPAAKRGQQWLGLVDTFSASPPYHQIKMIHRPCRTICTYTCIHACARCSRDGRWLGLVAITTATIIASASMLVETLVPCGFVLCIAYGYAYHDPSLPALFFGLLLGPCPAVVLLSNGTTRHSPRTRGIWSIRS